MNLVYFFNDSCGCCKGYEDVVDKLSTELKLSCYKQNIDEVEASYRINGIPTLILEDNGVEIFRNVGNLPYQRLIELVREYVK
jgi:thiol-disulfide isomerase/thioredoxin